jgi:hypothetical protein
MLPNNHDGVHADRHVADVRHTVAADDHVASPSDSLSAGRDGHGARGGCRPSPGG